MDKGTKKLACFLANDVRGVVPDDINEDVAYRIGFSFARWLGASDLCLGHDVRNSSPSIARATSEGILAAGCNVHPLGLCGTEQVYHAVASLGLDGGIMVTASHNPSQYNGMKFVREKSFPVGGDTGLQEVRALVEEFKFSSVSPKGSVAATIPAADYVQQLLRFIDPKRLASLKVVVDPGNGCAGPIVDLLERQLPFKIIKVRNTPDGNFPFGVPNPLLPENREYTARAVQENEAHFGVAWDGDFDRCFFFDERGRFVEGYYIVGLLAQYLLRRSPGEKIIHDPRLVWNTEDVVRSVGGTPFVSKTGHAYIKQVMRERDALYGGEMSAHHYFRDFYYCDSGMIPWLLMCQLLSEEGAKLSELIEDAVLRYPISGEINRKIPDIDSAITRVRDYCAHDALAIRDIDGLSMDFATWRFNLRSSNTENLLRLNVETRGDRSLLSEKTEMILDIIDSH